MKKTIYFLFFVFLIQLASAFTLEQNTTYNPSDSNVTYVMNQTITATSAGSLSIVASACT